MGGGGSLGKSESESGSESSFDQNVWGPQGAALQNLYGQLGGLFGQTTSGMQGAIPGAVGNIQQAFQQAMHGVGQQMGGGAYQGLDLQGAYRDALQGGGNEQAINQMIMGGAGNNYAQAMKDQLAGDAMDRMGRMFAQADLRASAAGQPGSSRHGLLQSNIARNELDRLAEQQTNIGYGTFDKDLDRKLGIAQRADAFDMGRLQNVGQQLGGQQAAMSGGLAFTPQLANLGMGQMAPFMAPWQAAGAYASALGRPTVLGSGTGTSSSSAKGFGTSGYGGKGN